MISKHLSRSLVFALSTTLCVSTSSFAGASVKVPAKAGRTITDPLNTLRNGKGVPSSSLGINGDFYIDLSTFNIYGPKANNSWSTPTSLRGPKGLTGAAGPKSTSSSVGAQGIQGEKGTTGEKGATGATGLQGIATISGGSGGGSPGATGAAGSPGATGAAGSPGATGAAGSPGAQGIEGSQGIQGVPGSQGAKGDTGEVGSTGGNVVQLISLSPWRISSSAAPSTASSAQFGILSPNKSYMFMFIVSGRLDIAYPSSYDPRMGLSIECSNSLIIPIYSVSSSFGYFSDDLGPYSRSSFALIGTITTSSLDPNTSLYLVAKDDYGISASDPVTFSGTGLIQLVGSLM